MDDQEIAQLELYCKQLYESPDPTVRSEAEKTLILFSDSPDCLRKCQYLLERGASSYSQLLAASTLSKLVVRASGALPIEQRIHIRNYVLNYFVSRPKLAPFVVQGLSQIPRNYPPQFVEQSRLRQNLLAKLTKYGWFDSEDDTYVFRDITDDVGQFLQGSMEHCLIGVKILADLVTHINQSETNISVSKYRKISSSFRDVALYDIFMLSLNMLRQISNKQVDFQDEQQVTLMKELLQLVRNCLAYDFIGTSFDESTDDMGSVHIPATWKQLFLDFSTLHLFLDLYFAVPSSISAMALTCFVMLASVRRSLFDVTERAKYLQELMNGAKRIMESPQLLQNTDNYHEFCRLVARIKANYQLGEIIKVDGYADIMEMVTKLTVSSLQLWQFAPNSVHYLLNMWQKMVQSCPFVKANEPHRLGRFTPEITKTFISSRLESVADVLSCRIRKLSKVVKKDEGGTKVCKPGGSQYNIKYSQSAEDKRITRDSLEDPLDDKSTLHQQLDQIATIGRCEYSKTCSLLISLFDQAAQSYQELLQTSSPTPTDVALQEGRLTWLVYIIGYSIGGRISFSSTDEHDGLDGELSCRVLQLMNLTDLKLPQSGSQKVELALLTFFEQFRKIYIGDQVNKSSKVYQIMSERVGIADETAMLIVFVRKIITNMKYWARNEKIINATLSLLSDLSIGFSSARKLVKLEAIQFLLNNHTAEHFPFLGFQANANFKCRTLFYTALGRLLLVDLGDEAERFEVFTMPLTASLENLSNQISNSSVNSYQLEETKQLVIGLCRDIRGLAFAFNTKSSFLHFFNWIYPKLTPIFQRAMELWSHEPTVTTCILKMMSELTQNRSQRLLFDVMTPNGVLLFREVTKTLVTYGTQILNMTGVRDDQIYSMKYKGITICFDMLKSALSGGYVNFGVLRLYGDEALDNALSIFVKLLMSVPQRDLLEYPKLSQAYHALAEIITEHHIDHLCRLEPQVFLYILSSVSDGLTALDLAVSTGCCATLDHILTYLFQEYQKASKTANPQKSIEEQPALKIVEMQPEILQQMLATVLNTVMFEDCRNMWSMSRPLLGLILLNEKFFTVVEQRVTQMQPPDKQPGMAKCFQDLMENVERNLATKNRDRFTQNLSTFRAGIKNLAGTASTASAVAPVVEMMGYDI